MNPHDDLARRVGRELHDRVDPITDSPISLDDVKDTAGRIRRRRRVAVSGGVVAAALAILVPTTLVGSGLLDGDSAPEPTSPIRALSEPVLLTSDAPEGAPPEVPYLNGDQLVADSGTTLQLSTAYAAVVPTGEEFLVVRRGDPETTVDVIGPEGDVVDSSVNTGMPVSSPDRSVAAWGTPSGEVLTRSEGRTVRLATLPRAVHAVEILGTGPCDAEETSCRVFYNESNRQISPGSVGSNGVVELPSDLRSVSAVSKDNLVAGLTSDPDSDPTQQCSAMFDEQTDRKLFDTCDYRFDTATTGFSPDGSTIVAEEPDEFGAPPAVLALLDARSGNVRAEIRVPRSESDEVGGVVDSHWEDEEHLLVKTEAPAPDGAGYVYTVFRVGVEDGSVEKLLRSDPAGGGPQPYILPN